MPALSVPEFIRRRPNKRLGRQQDLACHSFFRQFVGLPNLRKREPPGDRDGKLTACDLLGKLFQATRVRDRPYLMHLDVAPSADLGLQRQWPGLRFF